MAHTRTSELKPEPPRSDEAWVDWACEQLPVRVRLAVSGEELLGVDLCRGFATPSDLRKAVAQRMGIEPIGLTFIVDGQVWTEGLAPDSLWASDGGVQVIRVEPTTSELHQTVLNRLGRMSHNTATWSRQFMSAWRDSHATVFQAMLPVFTDIGYIGMTRILMLRSRVHEFLRANHLLTHDDIVTRLVDDSVIWTQLEQVDRNAAKAYLLDLHTSGQIDLGVYVGRCQPDRSS